jgi:hypothetical protein
VAETRGAGREKWICVFLLLVPELSLENSESFLGADLSYGSSFFSLGVFLDILEGGEVMIILFPFLEGGEFVFEFGFFIAAAEGHD